MESGLEKADPVESMDVSSPNDKKERNRRGDVRSRFDDICLSLNLDKRSKTTAWDAYVDLSDKYGLEEEDVGCHWLACAVYTACRTTTVEMVSGEQMLGIGVPLTRILKETKISLLKFFTSIKNWAEMAHLDSIFYGKIHAVERNYEVSSVVFNKYCKEFVAIFKKPEQRTMRQTKRGKVSRIRAPSTADLFDLGWMLYIFIKGQYPQISDDLVNSHHLLICCMDTLYNTVLLSDKTAMFNLESLKNVLPPNFQSDDYIPADDLQSIIPYLCKTHSGIEAECRTMSKYKWWPKIVDLFKRGVFTAPGMSGEEFKEDCVKWLSKFMIPNFFAKNFKAISREYEEYMLHEGEFDERIFLSGNADEEIGTPSKTTPLADSWRVGSYPSPPQPQTPLTNRHHLESRLDVHATPVSKHTQLVTKLHLLLTETSSQPSKYIVDMGSACVKNPLPSIEARLQTLSDKFLAGLSEVHLSESSRSQPSDDKSTGQSHLSFAKTLYYRFLEAVLRGEEARSPGSSTTAPLQVQEMMAHDYLQSSLFACAVEIILCAHKSNRVFPWVIETLGIQPFHFYKILEPVIKQEPGLTREMVKHLGQTEEMVLEQLAWTSDSHLFEAIDSGKVPSFEEVSAGLSSPPGRLERLPFVSQSLQRLGVKDSIGSPLSAKDRYSSPVPRAARQLFPSAGPGPEQGDQPLNRPGVMAPAGETKPVMSSPEPSTAPSFLTSPSKPAASTQKKMGSLELFYRKVYVLAYIRLKDLCERLSINEDNLKKIWTTFEYSLTKCPEIMRDRHLDQLIMCAIYVMSKVLRLNVTFQEVMRQYRHQPQAKSHVYRSVLLNNGKREVPMPDSPSGDLPGPSLVTMGRSRSTSASLPQSPGEAESVPERRASTSSSASNVAKGDRGDIINFYNKVYISYIKEFALKFQQSGPDDKSLQLSPMPVVPKPAPSPRQVSKYQNIFVYPHKSITSSPLATARKFEYTLQKSPRKDLHLINNALSGSKSGGNLGKRQLFTSSSDFTVPPAKRTPVKDHTQESAGSLIGDFIDSIQPMQTGLSASSPPSLHSGLPHTTNLMKRVGTGLPSTSSFQGRTGKPPVSLLTKSNSGSTYVNSTSSTNAVSANGASLSSSLQHTAQSYASPGSLHNTSPLGLGGILPQMCVSSSPLQPVLSSASSQGSPLSTLTSQNLGQLLLPQTLNLMQSLVRSGLQGAPATVSQPLSQQGTEPAKTQSSTVTTTHS